MAARKLNEEAISGIKRDYFRRGIFPKEIAKKLGVDPMAIRREIKKIALAESLPQVKHGNYLPSTAAKIEKELDKLKLKRKKRGSGDVELELKHERLKINLLLSEDYMWSKIVPTRPWPNREKEGTLFAAVRKIVKEAEKRKVKDLSVEVPSGHISWRMGNILEGRFGLKEKTSGEKGYSFFFRKD